MTHIEVDGESVRMSQCIVDLLHQVKELENRLAVIESEFVMDCPHDETTVFVSQ